MAASPFPARKSQGSGGMTTAGPGSSGPLDGPPPSPVMGMGGMPQMQAGGGVPPFPPIDQMAQPLTAGTPGRAVAPETAVGMMQAAETIYSMLDSMASIAPDMANDFALQKDLLQRTMGKLLLKSGQNGPPTAIGNNFPGGGFLDGSR